MMEKLPLDEIIGSIVGDFVAAVILYWVLSKLIPDIMRQFNDQVTLQRKSDAEQRKMDRRLHYRAVKLIADSLKETRAECAKEAQEMKQLLAKYLESPE